MQSAAMTTYGLSPEFPASTASHEIFFFGREVCFYGKTKETLSIST